MTTNGAQPSPIITWRRAARQTIGIDKNPGYVPLEIGLRADSRDRSSDRQLPEQRRHIIADVLQNGLTRLVRSGSDATHNGRTND